MKRLAYINYRILRETFYKHRGVHGIQGGSLAEPISPSSDTVEKSQHKIPETGDIKELQAIAGHFKIEAKQENNIISIGASTWNPPLKVRTFKDLTKAKEYLMTLLKEYIQ